MALLKRLIHFSLPHESNNQRAKLLHSSSLFLVALFLLLYQLGLYWLPKSGVRVLGYAANISIEEVVRLSNERRVQAGLSPLEMNEELTRAARAKGEDMLNRDYWSHVSPDGTEPWQFFREVGYKYRYAGENLARDFADAGSAVEAWMASSTHKENLLSSKYKEIGIAVVEGDLNGSDTTIIVQLFGTRMADTVPAVPVAKAQTVATPEPALEMAVVYPEVKSETEISAGSVSSKQPVIISPFKTTKGMSLLIVGVLVIVLTLDGVVANKKGLVRIAGRTFAHLSFLGMILAIALILKAGEIL